MLRKIRIIAATVFLVLLTLLFLDFTGTLHAYFGWMAKIQFLPAVLVLNVGVVLFLVVCTLLFGRVYCSVICPLGVMQDVFSWTAGRFKKNRFHYEPARSWLRYGMFVLFVAAMLAGFVSVAALLAPYSSFGRIVSNFLSPLWKLGNNFLASVAEHLDSYAFYRTEVWVHVGVTFFVALVTLFILVILAVRKGRIYCNTLCPVGTLLGLLSRYSLFRPVIDTEKCNGCGLCARNCKSSCIDPKQHLIDYSRCVVCMDCLEKCRQHAISYRIRKSVAPKKEKENTVVTDGLSRRGFLAVSGMVTASSWLRAQEKKVDGGLAVIEDRQIPERKTLIVPPGAISRTHFAQHCTACQLCVSVCPNQVLRPSGNWSSAMQPEVSYERGYCRPECVRCTEVCPAGAIRPLTVADKSACQIGHAVWVKANCIPLTDGVACGNCARHCPVGAITMVASDPSDPESLQIPAVDSERCIGCGACENLCPARPLSAIYVEGHEQHRTV